MVERCRQDKWHCGCIARLLSIEDVLFSVHAKETEMKKLLLGLTALFALSTAVPAYAEDKPADDKAAAKDCGVTGPVSDLPTSPSEAMT